MLGWRIIAREIIMPPNKIATAILFFITSFCSSMFFVSIVYNPVEKVTAPKAKRRLKTKYPNP